MWSELIINVFIILYVLCLTIIVHEYGHAFTAKAMGWQLHGWVLKWYGVGYAVERPKGGDLRIPAYGGLVATWSLMLLGFFIAPVLFWMNAAFLFFNILPLPKSDGMILLRGRP